MLTMEALWTLPVMMVDTVVSAIGALLLKEGATVLEFNLRSLLRNYKLIAGVAVFTLASIAYIILLKYQQLSILYALSSVTYIWGAVLGKYRLNEEVGRLKIVGILIIMFGVTIVGLAS